MSVATPTGLRCLVACTGCKRQFDADGFAAGSRFHCACGQLIEVPRFNPHDAEVVRCSSCSAPRARGQKSCDHCAANYTLHEQDMHTICAVCMTRVSDRARFCHNCATPIVPQGSAGQPTKSGCAACGRRHKLNSRALGQVSILECPRCAGIWLSHDAFELVRGRARDGAVSELSGLAAGASRPVTESDTSEAQLYRRCPECQKWMHRRNYGKRSGVILDACKEHGLWFDARELERILGWVQSGGETATQKKEADDQRHAARQSRVPLGREATYQAWDSRQPAENSDSLGGFIHGVLGALFDL